ncbi:hypothetical protein HZC53_05990 [Candidatus Uhrbacteria bacterium]|nr:hypothetical protein [Candidatus Uhrbacteria bacterium]
MGKKKVGPRKGHQPKVSLFAVLLTFTSEYGVCDLVPVRRAIEKLPSKFAFNEVMCIEYRGLSQRAAQSLQVKSPALMFRIARSTRPWIAYLERYKDKRGIEHYELRIIDGRERAKETNGRWSEVHKGADPIKFLDEQDLPIVTVGEAH